MATKRRLERSAAGWAILVAVGIILAASWAQPQATAPLKPVEQSTKDQPPLWGGVDPQYLIIWGKIQRALDVRGRIGTAGDGKSRQLGFGVAFTTFEDEATIPAKIREAFGTAKKHNLAVLFSFDHQNFWRNRSDLWNQQELRTAAAFYPSSLVYGKVNVEHPLAAFLKEHGVTDEEVAWCHAHAQRPDVLGFNYYPDLFNFWGEGDFTRKGMIPLEQAAREAAAFVAQSLLNAQSWFALPIYLTETSAGLTDQAKVAYINALYEHVGELRRSGFPLLGVNWWPLYNTILWEYREEVDKPLEAFLPPGGWNNGLYVLEPQPDGGLQRIPTAAVQAYHAVIRRDLQPQP